jgi:hypothetical protein
MKLKNIIPVFLLLLICSTGLRAQVIIQFMPSLHGQSIDGLSYATIQNTSGNRLNGELTIRIKDQQGKSVVSVVVPPFLISQGVTTINRIAFSKSRFYFGSTAASRILNQTQRLPEGEYEYCFELNTTIEKSTQPGGYYENCFTNVIAPPSPLLLIDPADGDEICNKRPNFSWQAPVPYRADSRYRLLLVQLQKNQQPIEAITNNIPIVHQSNLTSSLLLYPPNAPALKEGERYVWQVIAYSGTTIITRSEIWTFKIACDKNEEKPDGDTYRQVTTVDDGSYFVTGNTLRFSFENFYQAGDLQYSIRSLAEPDKEVKRLPVLKTRTGLNKLELDLEKMKSIKKGQQYLLTIISGDGRKYLLRFVYAD